jgi:hypothetical protein
MALVFLTTALDSSGHATYATSGLTVGLHDIQVSYAGASGFDASSSSILAETINTTTKTAATPTFLPAGNTYTSAQTVTISDTTSGATIYYTTNDTTTTTSSTKYTGAITVSSAETLKAIATASGYSTSAVATATYTINTNSAPVIGSMSPVLAVAGGAAFTLTVNGSGFTASSTIDWGTTALTTTYVSATKLTAQVAAAQIAVAGITTITVQTPAPGGGTSSALQFEVDSSNAAATAPTFSSLTATVTAGSSASYSVTLPSTVTSVSATCLNLPTGASCSYGSGTVTITTSSSTPKGTYQITVIFTETVSGAATGWILLPILLLPLAILRKRLLARGAWVTACLGLVLLAEVAFCTGCGGGGGNTSGGGGGGGTQTHQVVSSGVVALTIQYWQSRKKMAD